MDTHLSQAKNLIKTSVRRTQLWHIVSFVFARKRADKKSKQIVHLHAERVRRRVVQRAQTLQNSERVCFAISFKATWRTVSDVPQ